MGVVQENDCGSDGPDHLASVQDHLGVPNEKWWCLCLWLLIGSADKMGSWPSVGGLD